MTALNPYERFLEGHPVQEVLASTPAALAALLDEIGPLRVRIAPAPGKWSPAEILCHLADCELVFGFRLRQTLAEDGPTIQPFDQDKWAKVYAHTPAPQALTVFTSLRGWNLQLLRTAMPGAANRQVTHPERGTMTFSTILETMAGHDRNHIAQLERIAAEKPETVGHR